MVFSNKPLQFILVALIASLPLLSVANNSVDSVKTETIAKVEGTAHHEEAKETKVLSEKDKEAEERREFIQHHLLDSHDFHIFSYTDDSKVEHHISFPLPVILWDGGLHVFSSSNFNHGESVVASNGSFYKLNHHDGKVYKTDAEGNFTENEHGHVTNAKPFDLSITKNVFVMFLVSLLIFLLFRSLAKSYAKNGGVASGMGRFFEPIVIYIRDEIAIPNIGEKHYKKYMSHLLTVFFFIWFLNIFGLTPLGINVTGNIAITACLAIVTYIITTLTANKNYWGHIFWMPGVPVPMKIILAPIDLLGTIIKPFSLMIRLYANIVAGHIVLMSLIGLMFLFKSWLGSSLSFGLSFAISLIEILVALLQAYIFTMLSALYFGSAVEEHHHEEAHH
jgi:F-type H+-transporting ATPase subunit a